MLLFQKVYVECLDKFLKYTKQFSFICHLYQKCVLSYLNTLNPCKSFYNTYLFHFLKNAKQFFTSIISTPLTTYTTVQLPAFAYNRSVEIPTQILTYIYNAFKKSVFVEFNGFTMIEVLEEISDLKKICIMFLDTQHATDYSSATS